MSNIYLCSDLHIGHRNIHNFRTGFGFTCEQDNRNRIGKDWTSLVRKRDRVYVLGDSAFTQGGLDWLGTLPGEKILVRGNHCDLNIQEYLKVFVEVYGLHRYKGYWLSHAPIHPDELRGKENVHGHCHFQSILLPGTNELDNRYFNVCPERLWPMLGRCLISLNELNAFYGRDKSRQSVQNK